MQRFWRGHQWALLSGGEYSHWSITLKKLLWNVFSVVPWGERSWFWLECPGKGRTHDFSRITSLSSFILLGLLLIFLNFIYVYYAWVCFACTYVSSSQHMYVSEEGVRSPGTATGDCESPHGCWDSNSSSLQEWLLTSDSPRQLVWFFFSEGLATESRLLMKRAMLNGFEDSGCGHSGSQPFSGMSHGKELSKDKISPFWYLKC